MISSNVLFNILKYVGIALLVLTFILFCKTASLAIKEEKVTKDFLKSKNKNLLFSFVCLTVGIIFLIFSYYTNPETVNYLNLAILNTPSFGNFVLIFLTSLFLSVSIYALMCIFTLHFFLESSQKNPKKVSLMFVVIIAIFVISLICFGEANAPFLRYPLCNRIYIGTHGIKLVTTYVGYNWSPAPTTGFGIQIAFYALVILGGAVLALVIANHKLKVLYGESGLISNLFLIAFPAGLIGARAWYVVGNWERDGFNQNFGKIFRISDGGLTIMGASLGIVAGIIFLLVLKYGKKKYPYSKMNYLSVIDILVPTILLAQFMGRWGNFFNNEVHGVLTETSNFMWLPSLIRNNMAFSSAHPVYSLAESIYALGSGKMYVPLFFIEGLVNLTGFILLEYLFGGVFRKLTSKFVEQVKVTGNKAKDCIASILRLFTCEGCNLGYYLIWYGFTRIIMEPLRDTSFNMGNDNQWSSRSAIIMACLGGAIVLILGVWQILRDHGKLQIKYFKNEK